MPIAQEQGLIINMLWSLVTHEDSHFATHIYSTASITECKTQTQVVQANSLRLHMHLVRSRYPLAALNRSRITDLTRFDRQQDVNVQIMNKRKITLKKKPQGAHLWRQHVANVESVAGKSLQCKSVKYKPIQRSTIDHKNLTRFTLNKS